MEVGVIMGGVSYEKKVSLLTGKEIIDNLDKNKYEILPIPINTQYELIDRVKGLQFAFIALHGKFGEDGRVQALLESMGVAYSGSGVLTSSVCMDKNISKKIFLNEGIKTPRWYSIKQGDNINYDHIEKLKYPLIIKPNSGGSSIGTFIVNSRKELNKKITEVLKYDNEIIIEEYINGKEITCCILNGKVLPIMSIQSKNEFFDYDAKYNNEETVEEVIILPEKLMNNINMIALKCWREFKLKVYARIDMILREDEIFVLEINTLPGMTKNSLFPKSAAAAGMNFSQLLDKIIKYSLE